MVVVSFKAMTLIQALMFVPQIISDTAHQLSIGMPTPAVEYVN